MKRFILIIFVIALAGDFASIAEAQSFSSPLACKFQFGQALEVDKAKTDIQSTPLEWNFAGLRGDRPSFLSGGDTGPVVAHFHEIGGGVSLFLKQGNGGHLFTIWPDGHAFWSKHNNLLGSKASQQFRGICDAVRRVNW